MSIKKGGGHMPRYKKAILVYNQQAGQGDALEIIETIVPKLAPEMIEFTLIQTMEQGEAEQICFERASESDLILIMGGDGTVHECVNGLMKQEARPHVAILPTGTCNDLSRALRVETIEEAIDAILAGTTQQIDIGQQNERFFSNFSGVGLITEASKEIENETKDKFGKLGYVISAIRSLKAPTTFSYTLTTTEGEESSGEAVMILAMNGQYIGTVGLFNENISLSDHMLHLFIIKEAGMTLVKNVYNQAFSNEDWLKEAEGLEMYTTKACSISTSPALEIDSDGELLERTPVDYQLHPGELTFISNAH